MAIVLAHDAIHVNAPKLPPGQAAGYTTGSPDIRWTTQDWISHPGAVRICQDQAASDTTADILDVESGAATNGEAGRWYKQALHDWQNATRRGQRHPAIYTSAANVTPLVNALKASSVNSGPGLWVASWNVANAEAVAEVLAATGPYPIIGIQYASGQLYDTSVFSSAWLTGRSVPVAPPAPATPQRVEANGSQSWRELAHAHGTSVARSLWLTATHQPNGFGQPRQAAYVAAGDWNAPLPGPAGNAPGVYIWVG